ncbi:MAG: acyl-CoA dehydrogenase C-terminal domain-containing protein, partial [Polyangiales bacterium]
MLLHSNDYLELAGIVVIGWQHLAMAAVAKSALAREATIERGFYEGKILSAQHWIATDLPRVAQLSKLCVDGESSYAKVPDDAW